MAARGEQVDSIVTDPPYGLVSVVKRFGKDGSAPAKSEGATGVYRRASAGFMGQKWDGTGIEQDPTFWRLCLDVLKPGGHLLAFGGTRTWHRIAVAIDDAGFEIRDSLMYLYGVGFPKSHDVSKGIDKTLGAKGIFGGPKSAAHAGWIARGRMRGEDNEEGWQRPWMDDQEAVDRNAREYLPGSEAAQRFKGWGTALKPAWEPVIVARKPLIGTVAQNVLAHGTGALNIDGCRIPTLEGEENPSISRRKGAVNHLSVRPAAETEAEGRMVSRQSPEAFRAERAGEAIGRWPANVIHDGSDEVEAAFAAFGDRPGQMGRARTDGATYNSVALGQKRAISNHPDIRGDAGSASRFFYTAKASKNDRNTDWQGNRIPVDNLHPTVKPTDLMRWLVTLVTPPGGVVLDPFAGSGSTGKAARAAGFRFIGIEADPKFADIAWMRYGGSDFEAKMAHLRWALRENEEARQA
jgi:site-specific DNA-methyltransferase (adenine-specific)